MSTPFFESLPATTRQCCSRLLLNFSATRDARTAARSEAIRILVECFTTPRRSRCANSVGTRRAKCQVPFRLVKKSGMGVNVLDVLLDEMLDVNGFCPQFQ